MLTFYSADTMQRFWELWNRVRGVKDPVYLDFPLREKVAASERGGPHEAPWTEPFLSAKVCRSGSQLGVSVVLGGEAVVGVDEVQGGLVVAQHRLLFLLRAVVQ